MMSWAESTTWPWLFGRDPSGVAFFFLHVRGGGKPTEKKTRGGRSASSSTLDTRKICTTLLFLCSRCKTSFLFLASYLCLKLCDAPMILNVKGLQTNLCEIFLDVIQNCLACCSTNVTRGWLLVFLAWRAHERKGDARFATLRCFVSEGWLCNGSEMTGGLRFTWVRLAQMISYDVNLNLS